MKNELIKNTIVLLTGGFITKLLGMFIKMIMGRMVGSEILGLYMMIIPTFSLFMGLGQFGLPIAFSKLIAEDRSNNKQLFFSVLIISFFINIILIFLIIAGAPYISKVLLKNADTYYGILAIAVVIPFISISSLCRSYFFGKEKMFPHVFSNIIEDFVRLIMMILFIPFFSKKNVSYLVCFLILINVISESISIIILFLFLPKNISFKKRDFSLNKHYVRECLSIGIPNTTGRLIGSVGYFLEPILLTYSLSKTGYSLSYITNQYGILSGYVMPILLLPSFFSSAISQALLPNISKEYSYSNIINVKRKLYFSIGLSLSIGLVFTILFMLLPNLFLNTIYNTSKGVSYMRFLAPICLFQYLQAPISSCLEAIGKSKRIMFANILGVGVRIFFLLVFSFFKIGLWGLIFAIGLNVVIVTLYELKKVKCVLSHKK